MTSASLPCARLAAALLDPRGDAEPAHGSAGVVWYVVADATALVVFVLIGLGGHRVSTAEGSSGPRSHCWGRGSSSRAVPRLPETGVADPPPDLDHRCPGGAADPDVARRVAERRRILVFIAVGLAITAVFLAIGRLLVRSCRAGDECASDLVAVVVGRKVPRRFRSPR